MPRDPDVPKLPRGKGMTLAGPQIFKIVVFAALLVAVIVLQKPCSDAAGNFFNTFDDPPKAAPKDAAPALPPGNYVEIKGTTPEEIRKELEQAPPSGSAGSPAPE